MDAWGSGLTKDEIAHWGRIHQDPVDRAVAEQKLRRRRNATKAIDNLPKCEEGWFRGVRLSELGYLELLTLANYMMNIIVESRNESITTADAAEA